LQDWQQVLVQRIGKGKRDMEVERGEGSTKHHRVKIIGLQQQNKVLTLW
jgi:hypothetical protein